MLSCKSSSTKDITLSVNFDDTSNRKSNYMLMYRLEDKDHNEIDSGLVELDFFSKMKLRDKEDAKFVDIFISREKNPDPLGVKTYVYSDLDLMNVDYKKTLEFFIVDQTRFSVRSYRDKDIEITIKNKKNSEYNLISIEDNNRVKILDFVVNKKWDKILLSDLLKSTLLKKNERYDTEAAYRIFGDIDSLVEGEEYFLRLKSGKVTSRDTLKYFNYESFPIKFTY